MFITDEENPRLVINAVITRGVSACRTLTAAEGTRNLRVSADAGYVGPFTWGLEGHALQSNVRINKRPPGQLEVSAARELVHGKARRDDVDSLPIVSRPDVVALRRASHSVVTGSFDIAGASSSTSRAAATAAATTLATRA